MNKSIICLLSFFCACFSSARAAENKGGALEISTDFPGGNAIIEKVSDGEVRLHQDMRNTSGWWFYWNFKVKNAGGKKTEYKFSKIGKSRRVPMDAYGPACSLDGGKTWNWLGLESITEEGFVHTPPADADEVWYSYTIPYQLADIKKFSEKAAADGRAKVETFCKTRDGRDVPVLKIGKAGGEVFIMLTARHHACESTASYVMEGLLEGLMSDAPYAKALREKAEIVAVPIVDLDGVEKGEQGKQRIPHDHNRDYIAEPLYPEPAAIKAEFAKRAGKKIIGIDIHCPYIGVLGKDGVYPDCARIYLVGSSKEKTWEQQKRLSKFMAEKNTSPLPYRPEDNLEFGQAWNRSADSPSFGNYSASLPTAILGTSLEIPYSIVRGTQTSRENLRAFGRCLAEALCEYAEEVSKQ